MMINKKTTQPELNFSWEAPVYYKRAVLKPKQNIQGWDVNGNEGYVHSIDQHLSTNGGKISVFNVSGLGKSGYLVLNGYDQLNEWFDVKYL